MENNVEGICPKDSTVCSREVNSKIQHRTSSISYIHSNADGLHNVLSARVRPARVHTASCAAPAFVGFSTTPGIGANELLLAVHSGCCC
jgi:hypothetical protein